MAKKKTKSSGPGLKVWLLRAIAILGILMMAYLAKLHFSEGENLGSVCELGEGVSCEAVNTSKYSSILGIPVSFLGLGYFAFVLILTFTKLDEKKWKFLFLITLFNLVPSLYLSYLEYFVIFSLCIFCEFSKVLMVLTLLLSGSYLKSIKKFPKQQPIVGMILLGVAAVGIMFFLQNRDTSEHDYTELAQCLTENGLVMYGSFTCSSCARQREIFGDAFEYMKEIECNPRGENPETERCLAKGISHTPTFAMEVDGEELSRVEGIQSPVDLAKMANCDYNELVTD